MFLAFGFALLFFLLLAGQRVLALASHPQDHSPSLDETIPHSATALLTRYVQRGQIVQRCDQTWTGRPAMVVVICTPLSEPIDGTILAASLIGGSFIWTMFPSERLGLSELIADWGIPTVVRSSDGGSALVWKNETLGLDGWMYWGDAHDRPPNATLRLTSLR